MVCFLIVGRAFLCCLFVQFSCSFLRSFVGGGVVFSCSFVLVRAVSILSDVLPVRHLLLVLILVFPCISVWYGNVHHRFSQAHYVLAVFPICWLLRRVLVVLFLLVSLFISRVAMSC